MRASFGHTQFMLRQKPALNIVANHYGRLEFPFQKDPQLKTLKTEKIGRRFYLSRIRIGRPGETHSNPSEPVSIFRTPLGKAGAAMRQEVTEFPLSVLRRRFEFYRLELRYLFIDKHTECLGA